MIDGFKDEAPNSHELKPRVIKLHVNNTDNFPVTQLLVQVIPQDMVYD